MLNRSSLVRAVPVVAMAGLLSFVALRADDAKDDKADPVKIKGEREHGNKGPAHDVIMPGCIESLKLTDKQKQQAKEIAERYEQSIEAAWVQFKHKYREAIRTEALFITAVEDNLKPEQLKRMRDERRKMAHHHAEATKHEGDHQSDAKSDKASEDKAQADAKSGDKSDKAAAAREEKRGDSTRPQVQVVDVDFLELSEEQESAAEEINDSYHPRLRHLSREIERLHVQLIALEADELAELESVLTPEQMNELKEGRKCAPKATRVAEKGEKKDR